MDLQLLSCLVLLVVSVVGSKQQQRQRGPSYDENYKVAFGAHNVLAQHQGRDVQISLDQSSGSGIQSKLSYSSGFFHMRIKLPGRDSAGVVTAFYLTSPTEKSNELDFEFLGNVEGMPYTVQTNVILNGKGDREQRIHLWFDPTASFHTYRILWNLHQIVFFVDSVPIRVFKNNKNNRVGYLTESMQVKASIWNGDSWATDGGQTKINWTYSPFQAHCRSFGIDGCPSYLGIGHCSSTKLWWNRNQYWRLSPNQEKVYQFVKHRYMTYDYCNDRPRYPISPPECPR